MNQKSRTSPTHILAADCGSTTTKVLLLGRSADRWRLLGRAESPTTVEAPHEDVMVGLRRALQKLEEQTGVSLLNGSELSNSVDAFFATSSAGGGLQILVAGVAKHVTAESAERAALGAGAIVIDVLSVDDGRLPHEKLQRIYTMKPDIVLISGGVDGGTISHIVEMCELFYNAGLKPRYGTNHKLPIIYAGNKDARGYVKDILNSAAQLEIVDNIRPLLEKENVLPARERIRNLFMNHVMAQAPNYRGLEKWVSASILPTPLAVGKVLELLAQKTQQNLLLFDIGGATTDVFTAVDGDYDRSVSANLGMSYSIANVLAQAGEENVLRWLPGQISLAQIKNFLANKMIRPTTLPETIEELLIEHAIAREALRLSLQYHHHIAKELSGVQIRRNIDEIFEQKSGGSPRAEISSIDHIIGSGSILSLSPRRVQAALILLDACLPVGVTRLSVDSQFIFPQLGVLGQLYPDIALQVLCQHGLVELGTVIAPSFSERATRYSKLADVLIGPKPYRRIELKADRLEIVPLAPSIEYDITVMPARNVDCGAGCGKPLQLEVTGGEVGLILDGRGRPSLRPKPLRQHQRDYLLILERLDAYPVKALHNFHK